jgi:hypothetical protein
MKVLPPIGSYILCFPYQLQVKWTDTPYTCAKLFWSIRRRKANFLGPRVRSRRKPIADFLRQQNLIGVIYIMSNCAGSKLIEQFMVCFKNYTVVGSMREREMGR